MANKSLAILWTLKEVISSIGATVSDHNYNLTFLLMGKIILGYYISLAYNRHVSQSLFSTRNDTRR